MYLLRMRVVGLGPFEDITLDFSDENGEPRLFTVIHGQGGVGKTTLLSALANTRPGNATVIAPVGPEREAPGTVVCEYFLGQDDPERPHPLVVASPNGRAYAEDDQEVLRRREQAFYDRVARENGCVLVSLGAARWYSRQPITLIAPARSMARYDVRAPAATDDPTRADLGRETKQALAYATIVGALAAGGEQELQHLADLRSAMIHAVNAILGSVGLEFIGVEPLSLEPIFRNPAHQVCSFDALPTRIRHLVSFVALPVRALWAAYPLREPLQAEGIVLIDEIDAYQDPLSLTHLMPALRRALPLVQWVVTATSPQLAASCDASDVIALRPAADTGTVEQYRGPMAMTH